MSLKKEKANHFLHIQNDLGEGPLWHPTEQCLYWVDIEEGKIQRYFPTTKQLEVYQTNSSVGAIGFRLNGGLVLACGRGFGFWSPGQKDIEWIAKPIEQSSGVRMNDGKVDSLGRFWAGSIDPSGNGALYRLDSDLSYHKILKKISISNGLDWDSDKNHFFYTDSGKYSIVKYKFNPQTGRISQPQRFLNLPNDGSKGVPDGLTLDSEGYVWSARWDGGKVVRFDPDGKVALEIELPVSRVTSVTFGGTDFKDLFITTASTGLTPEQRKNQPLAGDLFIYRSDVCGLPVSFFKG